MARFTNGPTLSGLKNREIDPFDAAGNLMPPTCWRINQHAILGTPQ